MMFLGDHWIGAEPYCDYFQSINLDAVVCAGDGGVPVRMAADIPGVPIKEVRLAPYFFLNEMGENPKRNAQTVWVKVRRAILRNCIDRIGYGGYPNNALKFPDFIEFLADACNEFRTMYDNIQKTKPYSAPFKVAVLNAWGKLRSWPCRSTAGLSIFECLCGMNVDVVFISFDDIRKNGIPDDIGVILNAGIAGTPWSGGENWKDEQIVTAIRTFVCKGGGFIGILEPTAFETRGELFRLSDVLGVQKDIGLTPAPANYRSVKALDKQHFILEDTQDEVHFTGAARGVYATSPKTRVLMKEGTDIALATHEYGQGRSVYFANLDWNYDCLRLLLRSIYWAANRQDDLKKWFSSNINTECFAYPETDYFVVINNNQDEAQETVVYDANGRTKKVALEAMESKWFKISEF